MHRKILELLGKEEPVALQIVVGTTGSTPQRVGAKALVDREGRLLAGTIGGGLMESKAIAAGAKVLESNCAALFEFSMIEPYGREAGPICGGTMRIFAMPCSAAVGRAYRDAVEASERRDRGLLLTTISGAGTGTTRWLQADGDDHRSNPAQKFAAFLEEETAGTLDLHERGQELFVEPISTPPRMLLVGGGHVAQSIAQQATWLGFGLTVLDDRAEFAKADRFPTDTKILCGDIRHEVERFPKDRNTYIVLVSKGHKPDAEALEGCVHSKPAYIGMIGSHRKVALLRKHFVESGLATEAEFDRIHAPIGLNIGAVTVEEIATSIMAQVIAVRRRGPGRNTLTTAALDSLDRVTP